MPENRIRETLKRKYQLAYERLQSLEGVVVVDLHIDEHTTITVPLDALHLRCDIDHKLNEINAQEDAEFDSLDQWRKEGTS